MNEKILRNKILENLKKGKTKTEIYEEFSPTSDDKVLRRILASRPSHSIKKSFRILHKPICLIWILIFLVDFLGLFDLFVNFDIKALVSFAITTYLFVQLWKFNGDAFLPSIIWLIFGMFNNLKELTGLPKDDIDYDFIVIVTWSYMAIIISVIGLTYLIRKSVFSYYKWFKPILDYKNQIVFQEE